MMEIFLFHINAYRIIQMICGTVEIVGMRPLTGLTFSDTRAISINNADLEVITC
jgi:hypothetical protein